MPLPHITLALHSLSSPLNRAEATYYLGPSRFRQLISWTRLLQLQTASLEDFRNCIAPARAVVLTFDDAYDDLYQELLPLVCEHKLKLSVYVVVNHIGGYNDFDGALDVRRRRLLTLAEMREMQKYGVAFGSHSLTHSVLTTLSEIQLRSEIRDSKSRLEDLLGTAVSTFSYPYGAVNAEVRDAVMDAGYEAAFGFEPRGEEPLDAFCLPRANVCELDTMPDLIFKSLTGYNVRHWLRLQGERTALSLPEPLRTKAMLFVQRHRSQCREA